jgi:hypothetical protein
VTGAWYAQPFRADGGITAEGLRNQLGRPSLSLLTVLVRESAQNSWDARTGSVVTFEIDIRSVESGRMRDWRALLGAFNPMVSDSDFALRRVLRQPSFRCLTISDRGTAGLGGPTRSDHVAELGRRNWLSFVLNSGEARDVDGGGGTYGYGKGAFFLVSRVGTILIYTRFESDGQIKTRLIGSALGRSYAHEDRPFTGRHWWGRPAQDHCEPLEDAEADLVAGRLGLPLFASHETGTTVVIIEPDFADPTMPDDTSGQLDARAAGTFLAEAMAWNLWPITMAGRSPGMVTRTTVDGVSVPVPDAESDAVIASFTAAYQRMRNGEGEDVECGRPRRRLGRLAYEKTFGAVTESQAARDLGIEGAPHHICLMRSPDLVVRYLEGPSGPHAAIGYAGVMRVEDALDPIFAKAEPPTHDVWMDTQLQGVEATYVRVTHRRLRERARQISGLTRADAAVTDAPVGLLSHRLGHLLAGVNPAEDAVGGRPGGTAWAESNEPSALPGARGAADAHRGGTAHRPGRPRLDGKPAYVGSPVGTVIEQRVYLPGRGKYQAEVQVLTGDGRTESDPYSGARLPRIIGWRGEDAMVRGDTLVTEVPLDVVVIVEPVPDAVMEIAIRVTL